MNSSISADISILDIILRITCAMVVGLLIGVEREFTHRPAGLRTHMLVSLGACTVMITGELIYRQYHAFGSTPDPARLAAQVITGVGFLGAGTIMREGANVTGLTTAASLWAVACLGIAAGGGYYKLTIVGAIATFLILTVFVKFQKRFVDTKNFSIAYSGTTYSLTQATKAITEAAEANDVVITELSTSRMDNGIRRFSFVASFYGVHATRNQSEFFAQLAEKESINSVTQN